LHNKNKKSKNKVKSSCFNLLYLEAESERIASRIKAQSEAEIAQIDLTKKISAKEA